MLPPNLEEFSEKCVLDILTVLGRGTRSMLEAEITPPKFELAVILLNLESLRIRLELVICIIRPP